MNKQQALAKLKEGDDVLMSEEQAIYLIDRSGSMANVIGYDGDHQITKMQAVKKAMKAMMEARISYATADKVGILTFGAGQRNMTEVEAPLEVAGPQHITCMTDVSPSGGTPMYQGFEKSAEVLAKSEGLVRIVLMSDGEPNDGHSKAEVLGLVRKLSKQYGFIIDTIGIGIPGRTQKYDEQFMKTLAVEGAGQFFPIDNVDELVKLLQKTAIERRLLFGDGIKLLGEATSASQTQ